MTTLTPTADSSSAPAVTPLGADQWRSKRGHASGLEDINGRLRLRVADASVGVLKVERGAVEIEPDSDAPAVLAVDDPQTLLGVLGGETHPFVAFLQGRARTEGNRALALRILFGLQAGSPWSGLRRD